MTKAEIVETISANTNLGTPVVSSILEEFMKTVKHSMIKGNNVYLRGFGTFLLKKRAEKKARNIKKGTSVNIPAHTIPTFRPAQEFENEVKAKVRV